MSLPEMHWHWGELPMAERDMQTERENTKAGTTKIEIEERQTERKRGKQIVQRLLYFA